MANGLVDWLFNEHNVVEVKADCLKTNIPSIRVLQKIGMEQVSEDGDLLYWSIKK